MNLFNIDEEKIGFILAGIFFVVFTLIATYIYISKEIEISSLLRDKASLQEDLIKEKTNFQACSNKLQEQNEKIENMKVEVTYQEPLQVEKIKNIYIRDSTCEAELKAYKELFYE